MNSNFPNWTIIEEDEDHYYIQVPKEEWNRFRNPLRTAPRPNIMTSLLSDLFAIPQPLQSVMSNRSSAMAGARSGGRSYSMSSSSSSVSRNGVVYTTRTQNDNGVVTTETSATYTNPNRSESGITEYVAPEDRGQEATTNESVSESGETGTNSSETSQTVETIQCPVCLEDFQNQPIMQCTHFVCKECLARMVNTKCPVCRSEMHGGHCTQTIRQMILQNSNRYRIQQNQEHFQEDISWVNSLGMGPYITLGTSRNIHNLFDI